MAGGTPVTWWRKWNVWPASVDLQEELTTLDDAVKSIAEAWTGDAHINFRSYYDQWRSKSANLHRDLRNLQKITHTAHGNYSAAQAANLKMWGRA
ncbi:WXG100 family type VII secretion target [Streptomyces endophytica]|uniref:WXG100 family type VII secretion target n=1 Tax=Streptomyces endophytica TaxID=2991496 RepID=A0ABY6P9B7_9ACTN|nr:WXG100 family type VII secretion target [Streptomyces endophytica]UZJ29832.1 WXG100 family type VII secretion target [Streptomyces endophytica]